MLSHGTPEKIATAANAVNAIAAPAELSGSEKRQQILKRLQQLQPWRMNIRITEHIRTGDFLMQSGQECGVEHRHHTRNRERDKFLRLIDRLYPDGLRGKRFLDCGCNAGGYCFWVRERNAEIGYGFDVREHWIKQARFIKNQRTVFPTDRIQFEIMDLYDLPKQDLFPFDIVQFKGLFYHLPDPINGLKLAADMSRDILVFSTAVLWGEADGALKSRVEKNELLHGGLEKLNWLPTGPGVCAELIRHLGFENIKLTKLKQSESRPTRGRLEIVAARDENRLQDLVGEEL